MKKNAKRLVAAILGRQVRRLLRKRQVQVIAVAGSVGKTSTKLAIAQLLEAKFRVRYQRGNYNDLVTVPLVFFGLSLPRLFNPFAWLLTFLKIEWQLLWPYKFDVVVLELGTDGPGQLSQFSSYLTVDIGVLTAITPEHMEFFGDLSAVAKEELTVGELSKRLLINADLCAPEHLQSQPSAISYGTSEAAVYRLTDTELSAKGYRYKLQKKGVVIAQGTYQGISVTQLYSLAAAMAVGDMLGMNGAEMADTAARFQPVSGRMQLLPGQKDSLIIDDSYNASPEAVRAALQALYALEAPQKIALLGNMNELGGFSASAHAEIGALCDPAKLDLVVTLGPDANEYLAATAERAGCKVVRTRSPYEAGEQIRSVLEPGGAVLVKGSQNRVFAEEAIKTLLKDPADASKLVRQSASWMKLKKRQFKDG